MVRNVLLEGLGMKSHRIFVLASSLAVLPGAALFAQTSGSSTADKSPLGHQSGAPKTPSPAGATPSTNSSVPGATGRTVVAGSTSTAGTGAATARDKTGSTTGESEGGGK
jgi:hypothetical protein